VVEGRTLAKLPVPESLRAALREVAAGRVTDHPAHLTHHATVGR
jgi:ribosomal 50S subunit-associated protein YjgA (DUF615 family)